MALLLVLTVCLLVYAALESPIRKALITQQATFPNQKGPSIQNPTARWVFQSFVGIHLLCSPSITVVRMCHHAAQAWADAPRGLS